MQTITDNFTLTSGDYVYLHWHSDPSTKLIAKKLVDGQLVNAATGDEISKHSLRNWLVGEEFKL
ncbi:hypothetical protein [Aliiglaciecola sp. M165]|uniref:hypothetical protein n=1 Tax=Aliiglaciecola sp. M165 TaxID=2593649 RepID=UPI00117F7553|nr:hypothetical protein [Aliiglaciecola sp. M165]TRY29792.1 hypothetical protein FM019_16610 [Aliiglaciecola sp. M165]